MKLFATAHTREFPRHRLKRSISAEREQMITQLSNRLLRASALLEELKTDARAEGAGPEIGAKWEATIDCLGDADKGFDEVMLLYMDADLDEDESSD